jgi:hypothetical protein
MRPSRAVRLQAARYDARAIQEQSKDEQNELYLALVTEGKQAAT